MIDAVILKIPAGAGHVFSSQDELQKSFKVTDRNALGSFITYIRMKSAKKSALSMARFRYITRKFLLLFYSNYVKCMSKAERPGRNPGTSTNVMIGMLNASQNRTNRALFTDALISRQPV